MCASGGSSQGSVIGAILNYQLGSESLQMGREQLAWERDRAARQDPLIEELVQQQIETGAVNAERATEQWDLYKEVFQPIEKQVAKDAMEWDSEGRKERMAGEAAADTTRSYQAAAGQNERRMMGMGVNPNSGRFQGQGRAIQVSQAADTAGAMNKARRDTEKEGLALRTGVAQFGRGMPATGISADSLSLNAGNSAVGNMATQTGMHNQSYSGANQWFNTAGNAFSSGANIYNQIRSVDAQTSAANQSMIGEVAGTAVGVGAAMMMRKGGVVRKDGGVDHSGHGLSKKKKGKGYKHGGIIHYKHGGMVKYAHGGLVEGGNAGHGISKEQPGGMVEGEGTETSDSVEGTIEGKKPVRLSRGEGVLNAEAVKIVGEEFVHNINEIGLSTGRRAA